MCLLFIAHQMHPQWPLIVAANRDEFHQRPTRAAAFWPEQPDWLGGRDLEAGGSWMLLHRSGKFAALTNVRNPLQPLGTRSRGELVSQFLAQPLTPASYCRGVDHASYSGFNLIAGEYTANGWQLHYCTNRSNSSTNRATPRQIALDKGLFGLSNASLDTSWTKVEQGKTALAQLLKQSTHEDALVAGLWSLLADRRRAPDEDLPNTGVDATTEALLSSRFIVSPDYGTRASTLLLADAQGGVTLLERSFNREGEMQEERAFSIALTPR